MELSHSRKAPAHKAIISQCPLPCIWQSNCLLCHPSGRQPFRKSLKLAEQWEAGMGRFYFHLRSGENVIADEEGTDLPDVAAARLEALAAARYILADAIRSGAKKIPEAFVIADSEGRELETVNLAVVLPERFRL